MFFVFFSLGMIFKSRELDLKFISFNIYDIYNKKVVYWDNFLESTFFKGSTISDTWSSKIYT